jgi:membrane-bound lytic murein transglycosylase B
MEWKLPKTLLHLASSLTLFASGLAAAEEPRPFEDKQVFSEFIAEMVKEYKFDAATLNEWFKEARLHQNILDAISRPAEGKPWYDYRPIFVNDARVRGGVQFWKENAKIIDEVVAKYQVPPEILVAIVGVETRYGQHKGTYPVFDSLSTLAFAYPPRAKFFRSELKQYLLMAREENFDPLSLKGSYAGAMGMPQFISSSFRRYAVDFDNNGQRDLWDSVADALGSVGNYFRRHGWKPGERIADEVEVSGLKYQAMIDDSLKPRYTPEEFRLAGVALPSDLPADLKGSLVRFDNGDGAEYWVVWNNFYVISRYNHSALYSMAVYQLSKEIAESR